MISKRNRKHKKIWITASALVLALMIGIGAFTTGAFGLLSSGYQAEADGYQVVALTTGTLSSTVTGTGSIEMADTQLVTVPEGLTVQKLNVQQGKNVSAGDSLVTISSKSVSDKLDALATELSTLNDELADLSGDTTSSTISATVKGRVKTIYGQKGDSVETVMKQNGALMLLSVDGYMKIDVSLNQEQVKLNEDVIVQTETGTRIDGYVYKISDDGGTATVLTSDSTLPVDASVTVYDEDGNAVGSSKAEISTPLRITGTAGTIKSLSVSVNTSVSKGSTLLTLKNLPISNDYTAKLKEREECVNEIEQMQQLLLEPVITSPADGIVSSISLSVGQTLEEDTYITLTKKDAVELSVSIDELDILKIQPGMDATVSLDAISGETFTGKITEILSSGTTSNNVTNYPVTIALSGDSRFLPGMSATATITVSEHQNALLVPVSALNTSRGETFVYVASDLTTLSTSSEETPGVKTVITTGLSNDEYAEVLSGLSASDKVVVTKSASVSSSSQESQSSVMQMGSVMGGDMGSMGGGTPPSGGPSDGGSSGSRSGS